MVENLIREFIRISIVTAAAHFIAYTLRKYARKQFLKILEDEKVEKEER